MSNEHEPSWWHRRFRYGPLRAVLPWVAIAVGAAMAIRNAFELDTDTGVLLFLVGIGLVVLGVVAFLVYRWMAKRGI